MDLADRAAVYETAEKVKKEVISWSSDGYSGSGTDNKVPGVIRQHMKKEKKTIIILYS